MTDRNDVSWRTPQFRQKIVTQIDDALRQAGNPINKNSGEMENHVFSKAKTKDEYLSYVARLILHVRELNSTNRQVAPGMQGPNPGGLGPNNPMGPNVGISDPINALQNLARQGTNPQQGGYNLVSTLASQNPQLGAALASQSPLQQATGIPPNVQAPGMGQVPQMSQQPNQMQGGGMNAFGNNLVPQKQQRMQEMIPNPVGSARLPMPKTGQQPGNTLADSLLMQREPPMPAPISTQFNQGPSPGQVPRQGTPNQFMVQNINMPSIHNPLNPQGVVPGPQMIPGPQAAPSPVNYIPSPSSQIIPSPSSLSVGPQSVQGRTPQGATSVPSPGSALNTPANATSVQSPASRNLDEQAYLEKVKQLSKYIEPLRRMVARIDKDEDKKAVEKKKELSKMKNLLDILSNPSKRLPMDTLLKCEQVLEKLDLKVKPTEPFGLPSVGSGLPPSGSLGEANICQPLLEALVTHLKSPTLNHTLQRTFGPAVAALHGPPIRSRSPPIKHKKVENDPSDIPDVLQGEIARLDQRFKVNLDPFQHSGSRTVHLICQLDDKNLPCVPPVTITVPENYPHTTPQCDTSSEEYESTSFLQRVQKAFVARMSKMPSCYTVTSLLDLWEMSVRQACAPELIATPLTAGEAKPVNIAF